MTNQAQDSTAAASNPVALFGAAIVATCEGLIKTGQVPHFTQEECYVPFANLAAFLSKWDAAYNITTHNVKPAMCSDGRPGMTFSVGIMAQKSISQDVLGEEIKTSGALPLHVFLKMVAQAKARQEATGGDIDDNLCYRQAILDLKSDKDENGENYYSANMSAAVPSDGRMFPNRGDKTALMQWALNKLAAICALQTIAQVNARQHALEHNKDCADSDKIDIGALPVRTVEELRAEFKVDCDLQHGDFVAYRASDYGKEGAQPVARAYVSQVWSDFKGGALTPLDALMGDHVVFDGSIGAFIRAARLFPKPVHVETVAPDKAEKTES